MPAQYHPSLGNLQSLSKGEWRGHVQHSREEIEILVAGSTSGPNPTLADLAASVAQRLPEVRTESIDAVKQHAAEQGWLNLRDSAEWELIGLEFLDPEQPTCFNAICYEGIQDIYGWWAVAWDDQVLRSVSRVDC